MPCFDLSAEKRSLVGELKIIRFATKATRCLPPKTTDHTRVVQGELGMFQAPPNNTEKISRPIRERRMNINVTRPFLPDFDQYNRLIKGVWERGWLTNNGPLVNELEIQLKDRLGIPHLLYLNNGTIALQIAIKALSLKGEVITTPFSYVATTSSIVWESCSPVMVDICPQTFNIDATKIEAAITEHTSAILATHVFGNACDVDAIEKLANKHNLKVIYDGAHAFGALYKGQSLLNFGDVSTCSFHATKLFHTIEGGCVTTPSAQILKTMAEMRNFGHANQTEFGGIGINGKNSEFHAAMGLCNLPQVDGIIAARRHITERYKGNLQQTNLQFQELSKDLEYNYAYFPIVFSSEHDLLATMESLKLHGIFPRRYFYPSLNKLPYIPYQPCPESESLSCRVLCLPLYPSLSDVEVDMICRIIKRSLNYPTHKN